MNSTEASPLYCGADLHGNNVFLVVVDKSGKDVFNRRVPATITAVNKALAPYLPRIESLAVEATYNWYWLVDGWQEQDLDVRLANPAKMDQYKGLKVTGDYSDSHWLAEQLRLGILPEGYIYPKEIRPIRDALRRRQLFVRQRTQALLSLEGLFARQGIPNPGAYKLKTWESEDVRALEVDDFTRLQVSTLLESVRKSDALAQQIEGMVLEKIKPTKAYLCIQAVPGIGRILGLTILLESGEFSRFPSAGNYASYSRMVKSVRSSNAKKKGSNNGRNGNPHLAWAFIEAATYAARYYPRISSWYERKKKKRNIAVAKKALGCKLAKAVWHVMNGQVYNEKMLFG